MSTFRDARRAFRERRTLFVTTALLVLGVALGGCSTVDSAAPVDNDESYVLQTPYMNESVAVMSERDYVSAIHGIGVEVNSALSDYAAGLKARDRDATIDALDRLLATEEKAGRIIPPTGMATLQGRLTGALAQYGSFARTMKDVYLGNMNVPPEAESAFMEERKGEIETGGAELQAVLKAIGD